MKIESELDAGGAESLLRQGRDRQNATSAWLRQMELAMLAQPPQPPQQSRAAPTAVQGDSARTSAADLGIARGLEGADPPGGDAALPPPRAQGQRTGATHRVAEPVARIPAAVATEARMPMASLSRTAAENGTVGVHPTASGVDTIVTSAPHAAPVHATESAMAAEPGGAPRRSELQGLPTGAMVRAASPAVAGARGAVTGPGQGMTLDARAPATESPLMPASRDARTLRAPGLSLAPSAPAAPAAPGAGKASAAGGFPPPAADPEPLPARSLHVARDADGVHVTIRDATLDLLAQPGVVSRLVAEFAAAGLRLRSATINGMAAYATADDTADAVADRFDPAGTASHPMAGPAHRSSRERLSHGE